MTWQERAIQLQPTLPDEPKWAEVARIIQREYCPNDDLLRVTDRVRGYLRRYYAHGCTKTPVIPHETSENSESRSEQGYKDSTEYKSDGSIVSDRIIEICESEDKNPQSILLAHGFDPAKWEIVSCRNNLWHGPTRGGGKTILYQSRLTVRPIVKGVSIKTLTEAFQELNRTKPLPVPKYQKSDGRPCMAEVNIADLHFGKLCWHGNTGENYDHKIAKTNFESIVERICCEIKGKNLDYILFVWSNDYFNSDNEENATTAGTPQDTDIRYEKMVKTGIKMLCWAVERFAQIAPVKTFRTPSNHDTVLSLGAILVIEAYFKDDQRVTVEDIATPRYYIAYGNSLIGHGHGDKEGKESTSKDKASRLASCMPNEARELWGRTIYHEMHVAHLHSEQMIQEINGVIVRRIASPTASDTWHVNSGYVGSTRKAQTFIYDKEDGNIQTINTPMRQTDRVTN